MRKWSCAALALLLSTPLPGEAQKKPEEGFLLAKGRAGQVRVRMSVDELYAKIGRDHTRLVDLFGEGLFEPALEGYLDGGDRGKPSMVAGIGGREGCNHISGVAVADPRFKTAEGIGVGSTLGAIRKNYQVDWIDYGEGTLYSRVDQIGMSFGLDYWPPASWNRRRSQDAIPDSAKVVSVLVAQ